MLETYDTFTYDEILAMNLTDPFENIYILYNEMPDNLKDLNKNKQIEAAKNIQFFFTGMTSDITNVHNNQNL